MSNTVRIDGLESRVSTLESDLRSEISSERYETEREISDVRGLVRDLEETVRVNADSVREIRVEEMEERERLTTLFERRISSVEERVDETINELRAQLAETRSALRTDEDRLEKLEAWMDGVSAQLALQGLAMDELGVVATNLLDVTKTHDAELDRVVKLGAQLENDLATLALRCGVTEGRARVKLSVDKGRNIDETARGAIRAGGEKGRETQRRLRDANK